MEQYKYEADFMLESGKILEGIEIAYKTYGTLNSEKSNTIWICHALTANADPVEWWKGLVGDGCLFNPSEHFIVCANIIGSCYGSTGPLSINKASGTAYFADFPLITIRDMVAAHILLRKHLKIDTIKLLMGGSMGGYQVLEWAMMEPNIIQKLFLIATSPSESAWGVAVHTAQRMAIEADQTWHGEGSAHAGAAGLRAARAIGMLTYRNYATFQEKQTDPDPEKIDHFKASSYLQYQGEKLVKRFNAYSYWLLTKSMDSHHLGRGRGGELIDVLKTIHQPTYIIGISSDILCPVAEQQFIADHLPNITLAIIDSTYGHDGFIIETEQITNLIKAWV